MGKAISRFASLFFCHVSIFSEKRKASSWSMCNVSAGMVIGFGNQQRDRYHTVVALNYGNLNFPIEIGMRLVGRDDFIPLKPKYW